MLRIAPGTASAPQRLQRNSACILCDGHDVELLATRDRRGNPLDTVVCVDCGLISHQDVPTDDEVSEYYSNTYRRDYHGEETPSPKRVVNAWNRGQRLLSDLSPHLEPGDRVFEVGAGIGCSVKVFELAGYDASGIEPGSDFNRYSRDVLRSPVRQGVLEDVPRQADCDLVLLVHVIEHFNDPRRALEQIHGLLKPSGRLYVECPNVGAPHAARDSRAAGHPARHHPERSGGASGHARGAAQPAGRPGPSGFASFVTGSEAGASATETVAG